MSLELRFFANFREAVGQKTLEREYPEGTTVGDVLSDLVDEYDMDLFEDDDLRSQLSIMKNGKDVVHLDGLDTPLDDGDTLSVFPPVAGGSSTPVEDAGASSPER
jgi:molybdopterin synthase sulfur carrier subunit